MSKKCPVMGIALYMDCLECNNRVCNKNYKYKKLVIGIDQSYTRTGISICADGKLLKVTSLDYKGCSCPSDKRKLIANVLHRIIRLNQQKASETIIICERIRTISQGKGKSQGFGLKPSYLISTGALIATIVDTAYEYNIPVYSVDTRSWKSQIIGSSKTNPKYKNEIKPEKMEAINLIQSKGFDLKEYNKDGSIKVSIRGKNAGKVKYDDDAADSACIALYGFIPRNKQKLKLES